MVAPVAFETRSSAAPTSSSGSTSTMRMRVPPNASSAPGPSPRSSADVAPSTPWPSASAATTARSGGGRNAPNERGDTAAASIGIAYGRVGWSTSAPSADQERVIQTLSSATDVMRSMDGRFAAERVNPCGNPPGTHARNVAGASGSPRGAGEAIDAGGGAVSSCSPRLCTASVSVAPRISPTTSPASTFGTLLMGSPVRRGAPATRGRAGSRRSSPPSNDRYAPPAIHSSWPRPGVQRACAPSRLISTWSADDAGGSAAPA